MTRKTAPGASVRFAAASTSQDYRTTIVNVEQGSDTEIGYEHGGVADHDYSFDSSSRDTDSFSVRREKMNNPAVVIPWRLTFRSF